MERSYAVGAASALSTDRSSAASAPEMERNVSVMDTGAFILAKYCEEKNARRGDGRERTTSRSK